MLKNYLGFENNEICDCNKVHTADIDDVIIKNGAINVLPDVINGYNAKRAFVIADVNTDEVAGKAICDILEKSGIAYSKFVFPDSHLEPDEHAVGTLMLNFDCSCDIVVGVGSGVINDISKILCTIADRTYIIVGTAPSMDGYASTSASMARAGVKVSIPTKAPNVIIGDVDILKNAPLRMLQSGLGDMIAKYVSICEWNIAKIILGEYYCEKVAQLIRDALKKCVDNADGLLKRDDTAVSAVFEGLVIGGVAMTYAGVSRPASGVEHYFSHVWDMRGLSLGTTVDFHGIQCAVASLYTIKMYEKLKTMTPNRQKALDFVRAFDFEDWSAQLREFCGNSAEAMIALEAKEKKYDVSKHSKRIDIIIDKWDEIINAIDKEMPDSKFISELLDKIGAPKTTKDIGVGEGILPMTFKSTKDIRNKYVLSHLCWDLGILDEMADSIE